MKRQLSLIDNTHLLLCQAEREAHADYMAARKAHRRQQYHHILWKACFDAKMKYEVRHGLVASPTTRVRQDRAA